MGNNRTMAITLAGFGVALAAGALPAGVRAQSRTVTVTVENRAPTNSVSFAPLRIGFNNGTFDAFNVGEAAGAPIISIAEGGSGSDWFPAFAAADPGALLGTVGGLLQPGQTASGTFSFDAGLNPFFTFGSMVVPSNDFFIGNDDPMEYRLFDAAGDLVITSIEQNAAEIWNAGSEIFDPAAAAFLQIGNNGLRTSEGGAVAFNFSELAGFNGLTTGSGYVFNSQLQASTPIYRISFSTAAVPEPGTWLMLILGFGTAGTMLRKRTQRAVLASVA